MPDEKTTPEADCWLHGQVICHEQTSYTKKTSKVQNLGFLIFCSNFIQIILNFTP